MELDESSRNLVCINTHVGLYRYTRMPYGISSAPAKCQETMDKVLQGLNKVGCIMDDIIITGASTEEHLSNLRAVLDRLSEYNIQLNEKSVPFWQTALSILHSGWIRREFIQLMKKSRP